LLTLVKNNLADRPEMRCNPRMSVSLKDAANDKC